VVMKALDKDRTRRYETASAFAADVGRFLNDEAVGARPPSGGDRFRKMGRRDKGAIWVTSGVAAALLLGTGLSVWQAVRATHAEGKAIRSGLQAEANAIQARANEIAANQQRDRANETSEKLRRALYAAKMTLIAAAWEANNIIRVLE